MIPLRLAGAAAAAVAVALVAPLGPVTARELRGGQYVDGSCERAGFTRCLALTFDDGPDHHTTPRVLETLAARSLRATFFVVGHRLDGDDDYHARNRAVLRDVARRGHAVGNHTHRHVVLDGLRPESLAFEIDRTADLIAAATGRRPRLFRAPFGALATRRAVQAVYARGYVPVHWELDTNDWAVHSAAAVARNFRVALDHHPAGGVVLMHDTHAWSVAALPLILREVERRNADLVARGEAPYRFVGLDELVAARP